ncbi:MAG: four helix bundle protein [Pyrinomonadaceae bacterium]
MDDLRRSAVDKTAEEFDLKKRSRNFALRIVRLVESLPRSLTAQTIGGQLMRSGTSVAANYRAACRSRSTADFIAKMGIVEEETDESVFWIEMLVDTGTVKEELVANLLDEGDQLIAIWVSSINTARGRTR